MFFGITGYANAKISTETVAYIVFKINPVVKAYRLL